MMLFIFPRHFDIHGFVHAIVLFMVLYTRASTWLLHGSKVPSCFLRDIESMRAIIGSSNSI